MLSIRNVKIEKDELFLLPGNFTKVSLSFTKVSILMFINFHVGFDACQIGRNQERN